MRFATLFAATALVAAAGSSAAGAATVYNFADFQNPVFKYGFGVTGFTFTPFSTIHADNCRGVSGFACATSPSSFDFPVIGVNTTAAPLSFETVLLPTNTLLFHPDNGGTDAVLAFTAPTAGDYEFAGTFSRLDTVPTGGNGVITIEAATGNYGGGLSPIFTQAIPNGAYGSGFTFKNRLTLNAGQSVFFGVNNNGEYTFDSTGLTGTITAVPEPATWAMMIGGFGLVGAAMRRRQRTKVTYA
jgi:hypothetical protein